MTTSSLLFLLSIAVHPHPTQMKTFNVRPDLVRQTIDNFAASDSWTVEPLIKWSAKDRQKIADLLFDPKKGIALSGWRFNIGGGLNHETITNPLRTVDSFEVAPGKYDWNRCPGQRWMLKAAKDAGVPELVAYSVTPPRSLTRNGFTNGTENQGSTNLKDGQDGAYASYLADIVEHFLKQGYPFTHISPINEPDFPWDGVPTASTQEGNRAGNRDILKIGEAVHDEFTKRNMKVRLVTPEATSAQVTYEKNVGMSKKYGTPYGNYSDMLAKAPEWIAKVAPIYGYHDYWSDQHANLVPVRERMRAALDKAPPVKVWQTEFCQMSGPRGEGGWGRDLGMTLALNVARLIQLDMTIVETSAWQWWLAVSDSDYKDGLIYVDDLNHPSGTIYASKTLWAIGNFSRYVRPGYQRVVVDGVVNNPDALLVSAYKNPTNGEIVIVLVNVNTESEEIQLNVPGHAAATPFITSDRPGHDLKALAGIDLSKPYLVPSRSVVTLVCPAGK